MAARRSLKADPFCSEARVLKFDRTILALNLVVTVGLSTLVGCESTPNGINGGASSAGAGSIALVLQGGTTVNTFAYSITGPNPSSGSINVASSSTVSAVIGNIAAGSGYALTLTGTSVDGKTSCSGSSTLVQRRRGRHDPRGGRNRLPHRAHDRQRPGERHDQRLPAGRRREREPADGERHRDLEHRRRSGQRSAAAHLQLDDDLRHAEQRDGAEPDADLYGAGHRVADPHRLRRRCGVQRHLQPAGHLSF